MFWSLEGVGRIVDRRPVLLLVPGVLATACWLVLLRWYSLADHASVTYFAFDKIPDHFDSPIIRLTLLIFVALTLLYAAGYLLLRSVHALSPLALLSIGIAILGPAIVNVALYPVGALDVFNYMTELKLTYFFHANPYLNTFLPYYNDPFARYAFYLNGPLFYGPAWLLIARLPAVIVGFGDPIRVLVAMKVFNLALLGITAWAIYRYLEGWKGWLAVYLFLANPLVLFEGVGNAHNDVMMGVFLLVALLALQIEPVVSFPLLTLSILVKFFTASLIPLFALAAFLRRTSRQLMAVSILLSLAIVVLMSAAFWAGGRALSGLEKGLSVSQDMSSTSLYSLTREYLTDVHASASALSLTLDAYRLVFGLAALGVVWAVWRGWPFERGVVDTYLLFAVLLSLLYQWYLIPALAVLVLVADAVDVTFLTAVTVTGLASYPLSVWIWFNSATLVYQKHLFQALFLTLPILVYLSVEAYRFAGQRAATASRPVEAQPVDAAARSG